MKPIKFKEANRAYAEDQDEYITLHGFQDPEDSTGQFTFCMGLSFKERIRLLLTGKLWCALLTFNRPLTPSFFTTNKSDVLNCGHELIPPKE
jgi:hypothetical protein